MTIMNDKISVLRRMVREACLALSPEEEEKLAGEVASLLANVELLASLPAARGAERETLAPGELRRDDAEAPLPREDALANAAATHDGFVAVPKVIGGAGEDDTN